MTGDFATAIGRCIPSSRLVGAASWLRDGEFCFRCAAYSHLVPRSESPKILDQHQIAADRFERCIQEPLTVWRHRKTPARLLRYVGDADYFPGTEAKEPHATRF